MSGKRKKRVMRSFKIDEISAVDRPAQEGAQVAIMKRHPSTGGVECLDEGGKMAAEYPTVQELLEELHDAVPNAEKSAVARLIAKQEVGESPEDMACEMLERATAQFGRMVGAFMDASGANRESAEEAVMGSQIGRRIAALIGAAERMVSEDEDAEDIEARRRAETARMVASVGTTRLTMKAVATATEAIDARDATDDDLDRLAKARSERTGEDFFTAYETVCGTDEGIGLIRKRDAFHAMATGTAEHGRTVDLAKRDFDEDAAIRKTEMYRAAQAGANARAASRALFKRAEEIQIERCDPWLSLVDALDFAKAERPELAKTASL